MSTRPVSSPCRPPHRLRRAASCSSAPRSPASPARCWSAACWRSGCSSASATSIGRRRGRRALPDRLRHPRGRRPTSCSSTIWALCVFAQWAVYSGSPRRPGPHRTGARPHRPARHRRSSTPRRSCTPRWASTIARRVLRRDVLRHHRHHVGARHRRPRVHVRRRVPLPRWPHCARPRSSPPTPCTGTSLATAFTRGLVRRLRHEVSPAPRCSPPAPNSCSAPQPRRRLFAASSTASPRRRARHGRARLGCAARSRCSPASTSSSATPTSRRWTRRRSSRPPPLRPPPSQHLAAARRARRHRRRVGLVTDPASS